jgi:hypothetical protein
VYRERILRHNWDKSLKSFPPCYSQSPLQTYFLYPPPPSPPWFETETLYTDTWSLRTLKIMPRNLNEIVCLWIRLLYTSRTYLTLVLSLHDNNGLLLDRTSLSTLDWLVSCLSWPLVSFGSCDSLLYYHICCRNSFWSRILLCIYSSPCLSAWRQSTGDRAIVSRITIKIL